MIDVQKSASAEQQSAEEFYRLHLWCVRCRHVVGRRDVELYEGCPLCGNASVGLDGFPIPSEFLV